MLSTTHLISMSATGRYHVVSYLTNCAEQCCWNVRLPSAEIQEWIQIKMIHVSCSMFCILWLKGSCLAAFCSVTSPQLSSVKQSSQANCVMKACVLSLWNKPSPWIVGVWGSTETKRRREAEKCGTVQLRPNEWKSCYFWWANTYSF